MAYKTIKLPYTIVLTTVQKKQNIACECMFCMYTMYASACDIRTGTQGAKAIGNMGMLAFMGVCEFKHLLCIGISFFCLSLIHLLVSKLDNLKQFFT